MMLRLDGKDFGGIFRMLTLWKIRLREIIPENHIFCQFLVTESLHVKITL
jgi:hypothetical protein